MKIKLNSLVLFVVGSLCVESSFSSKKPPTIPTPILGPILGPKVPLAFPSSIPPVSSGDLEVILPPDDISEGWNFVPGPKLRQPFMFRVIAYEPNIPLNDLGLAISTSVNNANWKEILHVLTHSMERSHLELIGGPQPFFQFFSNEKKEVKAFKIACPNAGAPEESLKLLFQKLFLRFNFYLDPYKPGGCTDTLALVPDFDTVFELPTNTRECVLLLIGFNFDGGNGKYTPRTMFPKPAGSLPFYRRYYKPLSLSSMLALNFPQKRGEIQENKRGSSSSDQDDEEEDTSVDVGTVPGCSAPSLTKKQEKTKARNQKKKDKKREKAEENALLMSMQKARTDSGVKAQVVAPSSSQGYFPAYRFFCGKEEGGAEEVTEGVLDRLGIPAKKEQLDWIKTWMKDGLGPVVEDIWKGEGVKFVHMVTAEGEIIICVDSKDLLCALSITCSSEKWLLTWHTLAKTFIGKDTSQTPGESANNYLAMHKTLDVRNDALNYCKGNLVHYAQLRQENIFLQSGKTPSSPTARFALKNFIQKFAPIFSEWGFRSLLNSELFGPGTDIILLDRIYKFFSEEYDKSKETPPQNTTDLLVQKKTGISAQNLAKMSGARLIKRPEKMGMDFNLFFGKFIPFVLSEYFPTMLTLPEALREFSPLQEAFSFSSPNLFIYMNACLGVDIKKMDMKGNEAITSAYEEVKKLNMMQLSAFLLNTASFLAAFNKTPDSPERLMDLYAIIDNLNLHIKSSLDILGQDPNYENLSRVLGWGENLITWRVVLRTPHSSVPSSTASEHPGAMVVVPGPVGAAGPVSTSAPVPAAAVGVQAAASAQTPTPAPVPAPTPVNPTTTDQSSTTSSSAPSSTASEHPGTTAVAPDPVGAAGPVSTSASVPAAAVGVQAAASAQTPAPVPASAPTSANPNKRRSILDWILNIFRLK